MSPKIVTTPAVRVVIDANVLVYLALANLLLDLARTERLFTPYWSAQILEEVRRTLAVKFKRGATYATARLAEITAGFPDAVQANLEPVIAQCTNDEKDRHVLAAAIKAQASAIVTFNTRHFAPEHLARWDIRAVHPSDFLLELYAHSPQAVLRQLRFAATKKGMRTRELLRGYSAQLDTFKAALLADLR